MTRQAEEHEPPSGPNPVVKIALRGIDACLNALQSLRNRLAGAEGSESHDSGRAEPKHEAADGEALPPHPSLLRRLAIGLILLIVGGATGAVLSYRTLSHQIKEHAAVVERMQEELDADRKEGARNVKLLDKVQRENAEYRHDAREAEREAEKHKRRADEFEARIEETKAAEAKRTEETKRVEEARRSEERKRAEAAAQQARRAAAATPRSPSRPPQKTGNCAAGTAAEMAECIEKFNR